MKLGLKPRAFGLIKKLADLKAAAETWASWGMPGEGLVGRKDLRDSYPTIYEFICRISAMIFILDNMHLYVYSVFSGFLFERKNL